MTRTVLLNSVLLMILPLAAQISPAAQLYKWVDERGRVEWRDTPPPPNAKQVERRTLDINTIETSALPYSVQQAVRNYPVTLYGGNCGSGCDQARAHLARRGVPYSNKDPQADLDGFRKLSNGAMQVPLLIVGKQQFAGYLDSSWDEALDNAGYPRQPAPGYAPPQAVATPRGGEPAGAAPPEAAPAARGATPTQY